MESKTPTWLPPGKSAISWSQVDCANRDAEVYYRQYFLGEQSVMPDFVTVGNLFHGIVENPDWPTTLVANGLGAYHASFEKLKAHSDRPNPETEFLVPYESPYGTVQIKGFYDGLDTEKHEIEEIKTSPFRLWDQRKLEGHGQVKLYSLVYHSVYKVMPTVKLKSLVIVADPAKCKVKLLEHKFSFEQALTVQQEINNAVSIIYQLHDKFRKDSGT